MGNKPFSIECGSNGVDSLRVLLPGIPARSSRGWLGFCSVVLFRLGQSWALFDTGHYSDRALLLESLQKLDVDRRQIEHVILSHLHFDHVLNLPLFPNASVTVSRAELDYARQVSDGAAFDPALVDFWQALLDGRRVRVVDDAMKLHDDLEVVRLPGHTPGCLAMFVSGPQRVAVCGDVIKTAWEALTGAAATPAVDAAAVRAGMDYVLARAEVIIPGHDRPFIMREAGIEYLDCCSWKIHGSFFPGPRDEVLLNLSVQRGIYSMEAAATEAVDET